jgi:hypothetical protein
MSLERVEVGKPQVQNPDLNHLFCKAQPQNPIAFGIKVFGDLSLKMFPLQS